MSWNPIAGVLGRSGPLSKVGTFLDLKFWTDTALPLAAGAVGTKIVGGFIYGLLGEKLLKVSPTDKMAPFVRLGSDAIGVAALSWAVGRFISPRMSHNVFLGGVASIALSLVKELLGGTDIGRAIGLSGLGDDLSARMKEAVAARVEQQLSGGGFGHYLSVENLTRQRRLAGGVGEFVTDTALRRQPGYAPVPTADLRDYDVTRSETSL